MPAQGWGSQAGSAQGMVKETPEQAQETGTALAGTGLSFTSRRKNVNGLILIDSFHSSSLSLGKNW